MFGAHSLASLVFVVSAEALIHSLLYIISAFADPGRFQFPVQEFKKLILAGRKLEKWTIKEEFFKIRKNSKIFRYLVKWWLNNV